MRSKLAPVCLGLLLGLLVGCAGESADSGADGAMVVNIGYSGPLSGGAAFYGRNVQNGLAMAIAELNEAGGIQVGGRTATFNLVSVDDRYLPNETAINARRLLQQSNTPVIFVPHAGGILAVQGINTREPKFLLAAYSSDPRVLEERNPLTLMIPPRYDSYVGPFSRVAMERYGTRLSLLPTATTYGREWRDIVAEEWRRQGGEVLGDHSIDYNTTTEFSGPVTRALADNPDVLLVGGPSQPTALVIQAARQQGFQGGFIVMDQAKFEEMDDIVPAAYLEGSVGVYPLEKYQTPGAQGFVARFRERFGQDQTPTSEVGLNYQAMHLIARAIGLAGSADDPEAIRAMLSEAARQFPSEERPYEYGVVTADGHMTGEVTATYIRDGEYVALPIPPIGAESPANGESR
jgi:branched-chain amino acid transport system substrate-binding protein